MELESFVENVRDQFDEVPEDFGPDTRFRELDGWSSLTSLSVIAMVDEEYDAIITAAEIRAVDTVAQLFDLVSSKI